MWSPAFGQGTNQPIQDERLNVPACFAAVDHLPASYRAQLQQACIAIPAKLCDVRGSVQACYDDTNRLVFAYVREHRDALPETIEAAPLAQRSYAAALARIDAMLSFGGECETQTELCDYSLTTSALSALFLQARRAGVTLGGAQ